MMALPFFGDQHINAQHILNKGLGLSMKLTEGVKPAKVRCPYIRPHRMEDIVTCPMIEDEMMPPFPFRSVLPSGDCWMSLASLSGREQSALR